MTSRQKVSVAVTIALAAVMALAVVWAQASPHSPGSDAPGAAALLDPQSSEVDWSTQQTAGRITPAPRDAEKDRPAFYDNGSGCQIGDGDAVPKICAAGDRDARRTLMLVGDSKIAQWQTAFSHLGERAGWRVLSSTKKACPFTDAAITGGDKVRDDCRQWGRYTMQDILRLRPDVVITSQRFDTALPVGTSHGEDRTTGAMVAGLRSFWKQIQQAGMPVVVMLDNPFPSTHPVDECVAAHLDELSACAFALAPGQQESAAPVLREAARGVPGVEIIDMTPTICPDDGMCPAVIGDVLVYRAGSHLTKTFTVSAERQLSRELAEATHGRFAER
ncbi:SGNH hydrolase domain-containing protein [Aeromicrobium wangtongii]|uniref:SGNH hydrolase domain-containing protein n=1 Tax=Aeromicrobium wangtongii TaxID=2969247 RepID=UPI0020183860|nr:SGNH hydrolase domain-containing protein [Aeromicrobium wangtongii]MCL3818335.1 hypothetical protein [Aeromicrobium wangtongii]